MGQKTHPVGFRLGVNKTWDSRWYAHRGFSEQLHEDLKLRAFIKEKLQHTGVARILIERVADEIKFTICTARPGIVIGKKGAGIDQLKAEVQKKTSKKVTLNILEIRKAELDAQLVAENIASQLQRRIAYRRAMKKAIAAAFRFGAKGIKLRCSGRLAGAEIARTQSYLEGSVPLHTLRADIDYGFAEALTTYGMIGVKVWIYKGMIIQAKKEKESFSSAES
ncbi:MAG: 30S ribosomal protein S3 [Deltaproteobacteria bacterium]|nr:30S ribosomal protein S3 [Deltaproteobacteria bacterium]